MADMVADTIAASAIPNQLAINNILNMVTDVFAKHYVQYQCRFDEIVTECYPKSY